MHRYYVYYEYTNLPMETDYYLNNLIVFVPFYIKTDKHIDLLKEEVYEKTKHNNIVIRSFSYMGNDGATTLTFAV